MNGSPSAAVQSGIETSCRAVLTGHKRSVRALVVSRDGLLLYSAAADKEIRAWNIEGACLAVLTGHTANVVALALSRDGELLYSGSEDNTVREWVATGSVRAGMVWRAACDRSPRFDLFMAQEGPFTC